MIYFLAVLVFLLVCACAALFWNIKELTARVEENSAMLDPEGRRYAELSERIAAVERCLDEAGLQAIFDETEAEEKARKAADQYWEGLSNILSYEPAGKREAE